MSSNLVVVPAGYTGQIASGVIAIVAVNGPAGYAVIDGGNASSTGDGSPSSIDGGTALG